MADQSGPNDLLRQARLSRRSPTRRDQPMSRQELADAVNACLHHDPTPRNPIDAGYIGRLERGENRRPAAHIRAPLRAVLRKTTDAELGFPTSSGTEAAAAGRSNRIRQARGPRRRRQLASDAGISPEQLTAARKDLGRQFAAWRIAAGITQAQLGQITCYARSSIANVEVGDQLPPRAFWERTDKEVGAGGALLAAYDQVAGAEHGAIIHSVRVREQQRQQRIIGQEPHAPGGVPRECGCGQVVGRWTGREVRALREALRMSMRAFAEYLGLNPASVNSWERRRAGTPLRLATQSVLDQALKLADDDTKARFRVLLADQVSGEPATRARDQATKPGAATVTSINRQGQRPAPGSLHSRVSS